MAKGVEKDQHISTNTGLHQCQSGVTSIILLQPDLYLQLCRNRFNKSCKKKAAPQMLHQNFNANFTNESFNYYVQVEFSATWVQVSTLSILEKQKIYRTIYPQVTFHRCSFWFRSLKTFSSSTLSVRPHCSCEIVCICYVPPFNYSGFFFNLSLIFQTVRLRGTQAFYEVKFLDERPLMSPTGQVS